MKSTISGSVSKEVFPPTLFPKECIKTKAAYVQSLTSIHTHICVKHTTYGAFIRGYNTIIAEDAVNAFSEKDHKEGWEYISNNYGASIKKASDIIKDL